MTRVIGLSIVALLAIPTITRSAIIIDGVADASYGSAISTQALGTAAFDNNISTNVGLANGSELDAAYGFISNGVLYLVIAGNFNSQSGSVPYDELHTFFMADAGTGGDHTLSRFYNGTFSGRINNMVGMTFDAGFTANYWIGVNSGQGTSTNPVSMFVDYVVICSNCPSAYLGSVNPPVNPPSAILTNVYFGNVMQFALDNRNVAGVDASTFCTTNSTGTQQSMTASSVASGIEMAVPLATIGSPTGTTVHVNGFSLHTQLDEATLQQISQITGGNYYNAQSASDLRKIYDHLNTQLVIKPQNTEITSVFAGASILVMLIGGIFSMLWFGRLP